MPGSADSRPESTPVPEISIQEIFDNAPIGVFTSTPRGDIVSANAALVRMFGFQSSEEMLESITDIASQLYADAADRDEFKRLIEENGEVLNHECMFQHREGTRFWGSMNVRVILGEDGRIAAYQGFITDISDRKKTSEKLQQLEWMLSGKPLSDSDTQPGAQDQGYGDLTRLNHHGIILNSIGRERLESFANEYLELLGTSSAIYEANGDYAFGIFASGWCRMMDCASRKLCETRDDVEALNSGLWLCHESCWTNCSKRAIAEGAPVDIACSGGLRIHAIPIFAGEEVVGAINFGYGDPPGDPEQLRKLSETYHLDYEDLVREAGTYHSRPPFIIELAKKRLSATARIIGAMVETRQAEEALRESSNTFRSIVQASPMGIHLYQLQGDGALVFTGANPAADRLLGIDNRQFIGKTIEEAFPPLQNTEVPDRYRRAARYGENWRTEQIDYDHAGIKGAFEVNAFQMSSRNVCVLFADVTHRKRAEEALRNSEEKLRTTLRSIGDAVISTDMDGLVVTMNPVAESLTGWSEIDAAGQPLETVFRIINEKNGQPVESPVASVLKSGHVVGLANHTLLIARDGPEIPIADSGAPVRDDSGEIAGVVLVFRDQTDERAARQELQSNYALLRIAGETAKLGGWSVDLESEIITWSDTVADIHEMPRGHAPMFRDGIGFYAPEWRERISKVFAACAENGIPYDEEMEIITEKGKRVWVRTIGQAVKDEKGSIFKVQGSFQDITDRKQTEDAMLQRLEYEKLLHEASTIAVSAENLTEFNGRCLALVGERLGVSRAYIFRYLEATDTMDSIHEWCEKGIAPQQDELQGIPGSAFAWWLQTMRRNDIICYSDIEDIPDEATREMLLFQEIKSILVVPLFVKGRFYGFLGFDDCAGHRDWRQEDVEILLSLSRIMAMATQRRQAEEDLREERQMLLSIFNGIEEPIYIADTETYEVLFANDFLKSMMNGELPGKKCYEQLQGLTAPCEFCSNQIILDNPGEVYRWEHYNPNLNRCYLLFDRIIKWSDGRDVRFEMAIDITQRKLAEAEREKMQAQLVQAQKMESVGRLAGGVAHDFNNMLNVILGHTEMAIDKLEESDPLRSDLEEVKKAAERSASLTKQLLAFARRQTIAPKVLDLNETISSMLKMLERLIGESIELIWKPGSDISSVNIDPGQVDQMLANLAINARDAIGHNPGRVRIETASASFSEDFCSARPGFIPGDYVMLEVSDDGCGMDEETRLHIFEPFYTTKERGQGTGLGLATVYGIITQNGGFINVYSEPGLGTTFRIYLPKNAGEAAHSTGRPPEIQVPRGSETVLLVEDEPSILKMVTMMLEMEGYKVLPAGSPGEAIRLAREHSGDIHLLVSDVVMPEMNGRDLARNILLLYPAAKRLFMSGYTANVIAHHGVLDEGVNFIQKPFSRGELAAKIREMLDRD